MFVDALSGLFSVVAQDVKITIKANKDNKTFSDVNVSKTYGDMFKYDDKKLEYNISIN
jgi:hypothetical protein